jgi:Ion channel
LWRVYGKRVICFILSRIFFAKFDLNSKINWIFDGGYNDLDEFELYITSYYFTVTTIMTVGYGDITA